MEHRVDNSIKPVCGRLILDLQAGKPLAEAMSRNKAFFPKLVIALTAAGEKSGELQSILEELVSYYSKQQEFKSFIAKALIYPVFLLCASILVMLFFIIYVLPVLATTYTAMQAKPSDFFQSVLIFHDFLHGHSVFVFLCVFLAIFTINLYKNKIISIILQISWLQSINKLILEARFCKLLALLLRSGLNITEAVIVAGKAINNSDMLIRLQLFKDYLQRGVEIGSALGHSQKLFSPLTEELLIIGATTGYLPHMLDEAAKIAEEDLRERLEKIREFLAPTLLLIAAIITSAIVVSIMGPLFELFTAIPEY